MVEVFPSQRQQYSEKVQNRVAGNVKQTQEIIQEYQHTLPLRNKKKVTKKKYDNLLLVSSPVLKYKKYVGRFLIRFYEKLRYEWLKC